MAAEEQASREPRLRVGAKHAVVIGATGLVGESLVAELLRHGAYARVTAVARDRASLTRRHGSRLDTVPWPPLAHGAPLAAVREAAEGLLPDGDDLYSCLGTTRRQAGSAERFAWIDRTLNLGFAQAAAARGFRQYALVSSAGADPRSLWLYPRVKGELEVAVKALPFWGLYLFRPGLLLGQRRDPRLGERLAEPLVRLARRVAPRGLGARVGTPADELARAMTVAMQSTRGGVRTFAAEEIPVLAEARLPEMPRP